MIDVLIVEDDPMVAELNRSYLLRMEGFSVVGMASTAPAALEILATKYVSLVLLDVFMPGLNGLALLRQLRHSHPHLDVIMVTAARNSQDIQEALSLGVIDYIVKPFVFERFQAALMTCQSRQHLLNRQGEVNQEELDKRIFARVLRAEAPQRPQPKGIDAETLQLVRQALETGTEDFSVKDLEPLTGLSRISLKKYLTHLQEEGEVVARLIYARMGRPVTVYSYRHKDTA